jgi:hypothetical protein
MAVQSRGNIDTTSLILTTRQNTYRQDNGTILQDVGRTVDLVYGTLMARNLSTGKWEPFTDETAVDGTASNFGLFVGDDIAFADLVAGDVLDAPIITSGVTIDEDKLTIENAKTLDTVIGATTVDARTVRDELRKVDIITTTTQSASAAENA